MTEQHIIRFFSQLPFEPFVIYVADGRALRVGHPEQGAMGMYGQSFVMWHSDNSVEVIDVQGIVSLRTLSPSDFESFTG